MHVALSLNPEHSRLRVLRVPLFCNNLSANSAPSINLRVGESALRSNSNTTVGGGGGYIDHAERLKAVRLSIPRQGAAAAVSYTILLAILRLDGLRSSYVWSYGALALLFVLVCIVKLAAETNAIFVGKD